MRVAPPYGAAAVLCFVTGGALVALSHGITPEISTEGSPPDEIAKDISPHFRRVGLLLMVGGLVACIGLVVAMAMGLTPQ
jgi:hypothetical protein